MSLEKITIDVVMLLFNLFQTELFLRLFLLEKLQFWKKILLFFFSCLISWTFCTHNNFWLEYPLWTLLYVIFLKFNRFNRIKLSQRLLISVITVLFCSFINSSEQILLNSFSEIVSGTRIAPNSWFVVSGIIKFVLLLLIPTKIFKKLFLVLTENPFVKGSLILISLITVIYVSYLNAFSLQDLTITVFNKANFFWLCLIFGLITVFLLMTWSFSKKQKKLAAQSNEQLLKYTHEIEALYDDVAVFRHDYLNLLFSLKMAIKERDIDLVAQIFDDTIAPTEKIINNESYEVTKLNRITIPELKSLVYLKVKTARGKGIHVALDIQNILRELPVNSMTFIRMISILLDNAIEAAESSAGKEIQLKIVGDDALQLLEISNTVSEAPIDFKLIFQKGYTTKAVKENHGLGLYYVKSVVDASQGLSLETKVIEGVFTQSLVINLKPSIDG